MGVDAVWRGVALGGATQLDRDALGAMVRRFEERREDNSIQLWSLLVLERWLVRQPVAQLAA